MAGRRIALAPCPWPMVESQARPMRRPSSILLAMLLLARANAAHARPLALETPAVVSDGQELVVRMPGLPDAIHEVELELSLDGGRWVRVSPELTAGRWVFAWRVPSVATARGP